MTKAEEDEFRKKLLEITNDTNKVNNKNMPDVLELCEQTIEKELTNNKEFQASLFENFTKELQAKRKWITNLQITELSVIHDRKRGKLNDIKDDGFIRNIPLNERV